MVDVVKDTHDVPAVPRLADTQSVAIEKALVEGDVSALNASQRMVLYKHMCESQGLNVYTRPFQLMKGQDGKLWYYAGKNCADQLRKIHHVSLAEPHTQTIEGCLVVTIVASVPSGRQDSDIGVVSTAGLRGDALSNAMMKAYTKAKRRVTLSICGLSMLDESEVDSIMGVETVKDDDLESCPSSSVPLDDQETAVGPFADSGTPGTVSPDAQEKAGQSATPEGRPKSARKTPRIGREVMLDNIKRQFAKLCGDNGRAWQELSMWVWGSSVDSYEKVKQLPDKDLVTGLQKLEAKQEEQPPVDPPRSDSTSVNDHSAAKQEDVPMYSPLEPSTMERSGVSAAGEDPSSGPSQTVEADYDLPRVPSRLVGGYASDRDIDQMEAWAMLNGLSKYLAAMDIPCWPDGRPRLTRSAWIDTVARLEDERLKVEARETGGTSA
jgi:hypothetical protein